MAAYPFLREGRHNGCISIGLAIVRFILWISCELICSGARHAPIEQQAKPPARAPPPDTAQRSKGVPLFTSSYASTLIAYLLFWISGCIISRNSIYARVVKFIYLVLACSCSHACYLYQREQRNTSKFANRYIALFFNIYEIVY